MGELSLSAGARSRVDDKAPQHATWPWIDALLLCLLFLHQSWPWIDAFFFCFLFHLDHVPAQSGRKFRPGQLGEPPHFVNARGMLPEGCSTVPLAILRTAGFRRRELRQRTHYHFCSTMRQRPHQRPCGRCQSAACVYLSRWSTRSHSRSQPTYQQKQWQWVQRGRWLHQTSTWHEARRRCTAAAKVDHGIFAAEKE